VKITTSEPIDFSTLPTERLHDGSVIRFPANVDYYHGNGHLFLEEHTLEDILHFLISCSSIDEVKTLLEWEEKRAITFSDDECGRMRISTDGTPEGEIDLKVLEATFTPTKP
jgi:hypothetical protein